jgi:Luciferase-like monooxygenase
MTLLPGRGGPQAGDRCLALAQEAATTQAFCGGRLTLGVGVSHRPVIEDLHGLPYQRPAAHMRDYLSVLVPLLREGSVRYQGQFYRVDGGFIVPGTSPVPVLVGALSPLMVQAAGELAGWRSTTGSWSARASPRPAAWPSRAPRLRSRTSYDGWPTSASPNSGRSSSPPGTTRPAAASGPGRCWPVSPPPFELTGLRPDQARSIPGCFSSSDDAVLPPV